MKTKTNTEKGEALAEASTISVSPGMSILPEDVIAMLVMHHRDFRGEESPGVFVTRYHFDSVLPTFQVMSNAELSMITVVTLTELRAIAALRH